MSKPTKHTATSCHAKYLADNPQPNLRRLMRYLRMKRKEARKP